MNKITNEQLEEIIKKYKDSFYIICAGEKRTQLLTPECCAFIAISEESAKKFFDSIIDQLPDNLKMFSIKEMTNFDEKNKFSNLFYKNHFKYINFVDFGIAERINFINKNIENVNYIYERIKNFKDTDLIYSVFTKEGNAFSPTVEFRQFFFSNILEANQFINQYNNENLGLFSSWVELDSIVNEDFINDMLNAAFDGRYCSGWDIVESAYKTFSKNTLNNKDVRKILDTQKFYMLASTDDSNYVMRQRNNALFFTSNEKAKKFLERNKRNITHEFKLFSIEKREAFTNLVSNSKFVYIDGEYHAYTSEFLIGVGLGN